MPSTEPPGPDLAEPDVMVAELALGVLDGEARAIALRRVLAEPDFARDVEAWRGHLGAFFAAWPAVAPPDGLERRIAATIDAPARAMRWWRTMALGSALLAACLLVTIMLNRGGDVPTPARSAAISLVAALAPATPGPSLTAVYSDASATLRVIGPVPVVSGRVAQLWAIGADGVPRSLGIARGGGPIAIRLSDDARRRIVAGATLAISDEAAGGSPAPVPTGPVIASGPLLRA